MPVKPINPRRIPVPLLARRNKSWRWRSLLGVFCALLKSVGQGTLPITFDGPPVVPPGTGRVVQEYNEAGLHFAALSPVGFVRLGGGRSFFPENGTAYIVADLGSSLGFSFIDGSVFDLVSVDLAEFSTTLTNTTVHFVGYRFDGSTVTTDLTTDGIIDGTGPLADFQTFRFGSEFSRLTRVEIPTFDWCLDNLVVSVPEPGTVALLIVEVSLLGALKWRLRSNDRSRPALARGLGQVTPCLEPSRCAPEEVEALGAAR